MTLTLSQSPAGDDLRPPHQIVSVSGHRPPSSCGRNPSRNCLQIPSLRLSLSLGLSTNKNESQRRASIKIIRQRTHLTNKARRVNTRPTPEAGAKRMRKPCVPSGEKRARGQTKTIQSKVLFAFLALPAASGRLESGIRHSAMIRFDSTSPGRPFGLLAAP